jgi:hypothetical protein
MNNAMGKNLYRKLSANISFEKIKIFIKPKEKAPRKKQKQNRGFRLVTQILRPLSLRELEVPGWGFVNGFVIFLC